MEGRVFHYAAINLPVFYIYFLFLYLFSCCSCSCSGFWVADWLARQRKREVVCCWPQGISLSMLRSGYANWSLYHTYTSPFLLPLLIHCIEKHILQAKQIKAIWRSREKPTMKVCLILYHEQVGCVQPE